jgi:hypothetical protein
MAFIRGRALALALALALAPVPAAGLDNGVGRTPSTSRKPSPSISLDVWSEGLLVCLQVILLRKVRHPNIVKYYDSFINDKVGSIRRLIDSCL